MRSSLVLLVLPDPRVADGRCLNWSWDKRQGKPQAKTEQLNIRRERKHRPTLRLLSKTPSFSLKMQRKTFLICFMLPTSAKKSKNRVGHSNVLSITPLSPCPPQAEAQIWALLIGCGIFSDDSQPCLLPLDFSRLRAALPLKICISVLISLGIFSSGTHARTWHSRYSNHS